MAATTPVYTLNLVAEMLGENEELLADLLLELEPEDGIIWVYDAGDKQCQALSDHGIENLRALLEDHKANVAEENKSDT
jgi:hypothetical protein